MRWPLHGEGCASGDRRPEGGIGRQDTVIPMPVALAWTPPSPSAPQAAGEPNWLQKSLADLKTSFDFSEGLTISSISHPGVSTSIFVTGITQRVKAPGGVGVQTEFGWDRSVGLQLSYRDWYLRGSLDTDGKWGLGGPWRTRTSNLLIKSQLLYQLS